MLRITVDTRAARREETRQRILAAAWDLARQHGLAGVSLRELGAAVGMRAPALYTYFSSKNDIYDAMYAEGLRQLARGLDEIPPCPEPLEAVRQRARAFVGLNMEDPLRYELIFQRPIPDFVPSPESFAIGASTLAKTRVILEAAGIRGDDAIDLWRSLINGLISQQIANDPGGDRWIHLVDKAIDMFAMYQTSGRGSPRPQSKRKGGQ